ncbi:MAG TPA: AmmeMemoRadiSam system protein B, partial [Quisquiliibacterium sp.]|nr:AmmeMemoRadiSam system protein B [Quisquiliibacterium sp.]
MPSTHRPAAVAGMFYPADPGVLRAEVTGYLSEALGIDAQLGQVQPKLLVVPHAGYVYSGPVAACAYALLAPWRDRISRVVLLGPTHRVPVRGLAVPTASAFETPLGAVPVDRAAIDALMGLPQVIESDRAHAQEHSLEVQLPFLQAVLGRFSIVPLAVGSADADEVGEVLDRLWGGDETLVLVSSDLSHYLPYRLAGETDSATVSRILAFDSTIDHDEACGATPLNGALRVAKARGLEPRLLDLRNSGDTAGDRSRVVGYCAIAFARESRPDEALSRDEGETGDDARSAFGTGARDGEGAATALEARTADGEGKGSLGLALLSRARNAIASLLDLPRVEEPGHPALARPGATFVTLRRKGALRGCIGRLEAGEHPLEEDVRRNAYGAAFEDPRFPPLAAHEWQDLVV